MLGFTFGISPLRLKHPCRLSRLNRQRKYPPSSLILYVSLPPRFFKQLTSSMEDPNGPSSQASPSGLSFASFSFKSIGKPPSLLSRFSTLPDTVADRPPSPPLSSTLAPAPSLSHPTLIESIVGTPPSHTVSASHPVPPFTSSSKISHQQPNCSPAPMSPSQATGEATSITASVLPLRNFALPVESVTASTNSPASPHFTQSALPTLQDNIYPMNIDPPIQSNVYIGQTSSQSSSHLTNHLWQCLSDLAKERAEWDELFTLRQRYRDDHQELIRRHEDTLHAAHREKEQADRVVAAAESAFGIIDRLRARQEQRWVDEQRSLRRAATIHRARDARTPESTRDDNPPIRTDSQLSVQNNPAAPITQPSLNTALPLSQPTTRVIEGQVWVEASTSHLNSIPPSPTLPGPQMCDSISLSVSHIPTNLHQLAVDKPESASIAEPPPSAIVSSTTLSPPDEEEEKRRAEEFKARKAAVMAEKAKANAENAARILAQREKEEKTQDSPLLHSPPEAIIPVTAPVMTSPPFTTPSSSSTSHLAPSAATLESSNAGTAEFPMDRKLASVTTNMVSNAHLSLSDVKQSSQPLPARLKRKAGEMIFPSIAPSTTLPTLPQPAETCDSHSESLIKTTGHPLDHPSGAQSSTSGIPTITRNSDVQGDSSPERLQHAQTSLTPQDSLPVLPISSRGPLPVIKKEQSPSFDFEEPRLPPHASSPGSTASYRHSGQTPPEDPTYGMRLVYPRPPSPPHQDYTSHYPSMPMDNTFGTNSYVSGFPYEHADRWTTASGVDANPGAYADDPMVNSSVFDRPTSPSPTRSTPGQDRARVHRNEVLHNEVRNIKNPRRGPSARVPRKRPFDSDRHWDSESSIRNRRRISEAGDRSYQQPRVHSRPGSPSISRPDLPAARQTVQIASNRRGDRGYDSYVPPMEDSHYEPGMDERSGESMALRTRIGMQDNYPVRISSYGGSTSEDGGDPTMGRHIISRNAPATRTGGTTLSKPPRSPEDRFRANNKNRQGARNGSPRGVNSRPLASRINPSLEQRLS